jgi:predicted dehydrogenase
MRIGIVGCGNIADPYAQRIGAAPGLTLKGAADSEPGRADAFAAKYGGIAYRQSTSFSRTRRSTRS